MKAALLVLCSGCLVLPSKTTTTKQVGTQTELERGAIQSVALAGKAEGDQVAVQATATRACQRKVMKVIEVREHESLRFGGPDDARAKVFGFLLAPVTIPVSGFVSLFVISGSDHVATHNELDHAEPTSCKTPGSELAITAQLPSGSRRLLTTDSAGGVAVEIPTTEPYAGEVTLRASQAEDARVEYHRPVPPLTAARDAVLACGVEHGVAGYVRLELVLDERGVPTHMKLDNGDGAFVGCVGKGIAGKSFPFHDQTIVVPLELPALYHGGLQRRAERGGGGVS
jgi:hypothetical protein